MDREAWKGLTQWDMTEATQHAPKLKIICYFTQKKKTLLGIYSTNILVSAHKDVQHKVICKQKEQF